MKPFKRYGHIPVALFIILSLSIQGCSDSSTDSKRNYPVSWSSGYRMADFLSTEVTIEKQQDLRYLLEVPWYTEIVVTGTKSSDQAIFSNCKTYLSEATEKTRTLRENEINAFLVLTMMCRATDVLLNATAAHRSNIPTDFFNESTPQKFPVALALVISESEFAKYAQDKSIKYWGDVNKKHQIEFISNDQVEFHHDGGIQRLALVGRGDFNGDETEDILISSRDSVVGGSYFNIRLFALSVDTEGEWQLIEEFTF